MEKNTSFPTPTVGGSSLLVIFSVLCLTVFALLSLSTVQAEKRLADASIDSVIAYYAADSRAEQIFSQLRGGLLPEEVAVSGSIYSYTCPISETQILAVSVKHEGGQWTVLHWQAVSTAEFSADSGLSLWDGSST